MPLDSCCAPAADWSTPPVYALIPYSRESCPVLTPARMVSRPATSPAPPGIRAVAPAFSCANNAALGALFAATTSGVVSVTTAWTVGTLAPNALTAPAIAAVSWARVCLVAPVLLISAATAGLLFVAASESPRAYASQKAWP